MEKVRLGIIGFGNMGTIHSKNITSGKTPKVELAALCDIDADKRAKFESTYPGIPTFADAEDMYKSGLIDAVLIAVPHYDHPPLAIKAFSYGLHVLTEKPAGVYTKQVLEMNEAAKKSGKVFGIMYNQRTKPVFQKVKEMYESGQLGKIKRISWTITHWYRPQAYHDSGAWRSTWATEGGGTLINQNPHQLDLWQWMFGMPSKIMSFCKFGKYYDIEVEDEVVAYMEYDNGITGTYITSTGEAPGHNLLEIACDMGKLTVENDEKLTFHRNVVSEREHNAKLTVNDNVFAFPECWKCEIPIHGEATHHSGILNDYAEVILGNKENLLAPGYEGINGLTISNAIHYSTWTGKWADCKNFPHDEFYGLLQEKIANSTYVKKEVKAKASDLSGTY